MAIPFGCGKPDDRWPDYVPPEKIAWDTLDFGPPRTVGGPGSDPDCLNVEVRRQRALAEASLLRGFSYRVDCGWERQTLGWARDSMSGMWLWSHDSYSWLHSEWRSESGYGTPFWKRDDYQRAWKCLQEVRRSVPWPADQKTRVQAWPGLCFRDNLEGALFAHELALAVRWIWGNGAELSCKKHMVAARRPPRFSLIAAIVCHYHGTPRKGRSDAWWIGRATITTPTLPWAPVQGFDDGFAKERCLKSSELLYQQGFGLGEAARCAIKGKKGEDRLLALLHFFVEEQAKRRPYGKDGAQGGEGAT